MARDMDFKENICVLKKSTVHFERKKSFSAALILILYLQLLKLRKLHPSVTILLDPP